VTVSAVIGAVLTMALLAAVFVRRARPASLLPYYAGLFLALGAAWAVRPSALLGLPLALAQLSGALLVAAPVFFSGVVFALSLGRAGDASYALGSNLLGSVLGGFLEYASLGSGIRALTLLAGALYALSALALHGRRRDAV
jgi:hypothetical protein